MFAQEPAFEAPAVDGLHNPVQHDALRSIFWMLRRTFFTGLACMLSSGPGKRRIGATTFFAAQSIRRFSLAWPYFRISVAQRRMSWPFDMLATFLQNLSSTSAFLPGAWNDNSSDVLETGRSRNVLVFFSDLLLVILARST